MTGQNMYTGKDQSYQGKIATVYSNSSNKQPETPKKADTTRTYKIKFEMPKDIMDRVAMLTELSDAEWSGFIFYKRKRIKEGNGVNHRIVAVDFPEIPPQHNTGGGTHIDPSDMTEFLQNHLGEKDVSKWKIIWVHSHVNMGVFWSDTDIENINEWPYTRDLLSIVVNKKGEHKIRYDMYYPYRFHTDEVELTISGNEELRKACEEELVKINLSSRRGEENKQVEEERHPLTVQEWEDAYDYWENQHGGNGETGFSPTRAIPFQGRESQRDYMEEYIDSNRTGAGPNSNGTATEENEEPPTEIYHRDGSVTEIRYENGKRISRRIPATEADPNAPKGDISIVDTADSFEDKWINMGILETPFLTMAEIQNLFDDIGIIALSDNQIINRAKRGFMNRRPIAKIMCLFKGNAIDEQYENEEFLTWLTLSDLDIVQESEELKRCAEKFIKDRCIDHFQNPNRNFFVFTRFMYSVLSVLLDRDLELYMSENKEAYLELMAEHDSIVTDQIYACDFREKDFGSLGEYEVYQEFKKGLQDASDMDEGVVNKDA